MSNFFTRLAAGAVVLAVAGGGAVALNGVASAQTPPVGTITITPATGTDITPPMGTLSGPCDAVAADGTTSDGYAAFLSGPGVFTPNAGTGKPFGVSVQFGTGGSFSKTEAFTFPFRLSFIDLAKEQGQDSVLPGDYVLTAQCTESFEQRVYQEFKVGITFTTPTTYVTSPSASPSPGPEVSPSPGPEVSPSPGPEVSPSPGPEVSPSPGPEVSPSPSPEVSPSPTPSPGSGGDELLEHIIARVTAAVQAVIHFLQSLFKLDLGGLRFDVGPR